MDHDAKQSTTVYVRALPVDQLPKEVQSQTGDATEVYSIHSTDGQCLALASDRSHAFVLARQNAFTPVSVH